MLNTAHKIVAFLAIGLGIVHSTFTATLGKFNLYAFWFLGAGLALIFTGFLNLAFIRSPKNNRLVRVLCIIANFTLTILFVIALLTFLQEPQVFVGIGIFALATVFSILQKSE